MVSDEIPARAVIPPTRPTLSVIVPFFNEEEVLPTFLAELRQSVDDLEDDAHEEPGYACEVLLIDDGSTDRTEELLAAACVLRTGWRTVALASNQGQAAALYAGMKAASGDWLVLLDGDGQNDPADIPRVLALLQAGADLGVGVRVARRDDWRRRSMSRLANAVRRRLLRDGVRDTGCGLKAMKHDVAEALIPIRTLYSFIPALAAGAGFRVAEVPVAHRPRMGGESKYGVKKFLFWPLLDMLGVWWFTRRRCGGGVRASVPTVSERLDVDRQPVEA